MRKNPSRNCIVAFKFIDPIKHVANNTIKIKHLSDNIDLRSKAIVILQYARTYNSIT